MSCEYMTDAQDKWPERIYREVEVAPGVYAMRDMAREMADTELIEAVLNPL